MMARKSAFRLRLAAGVLLCVSVLFPLYSVPVSYSGDSVAEFTWDLLRDDPTNTTLLLIGYLGPILIVGAHSRRLAPAQAALVMVIEPLVLGISGAVLLAIAGSVFSMVPVLGPWLWGPVSGSIGLGTWLALGADGLLLLLWIVSVGSRLRSWWLTRANWATAST